MVCDKRDIINVLLGHDTESVIALERGGSELHVFDERFLILSRLCSSAHFHKVSFKYVDILSMHLHELARRNKGKLLFLYASEDQRHLLREIARLVESSYIIPDKDL